MTNSAPTPHEIERAIRNVPDFPKVGIQFKDITPVLADARLFSGTIDLLTSQFRPGSVDAVVGIDARGFIFAAAVAVKLNAGFVPVRKVGKLPHTKIRVSYDLEYGTDSLEMHSDAVEKGQKVLIHAGSGGVGTIAIQVAKHLGAAVPTTTSSANVDFVTSLGADVVIDYKKDDFEKNLRDYDVVLNSLDGQTLRRSLNVSNHAAGSSRSPARRIRRSRKRWD